MRATRKMRAAFATAAAAATLLAASAPASGRGPFGEGDGGFGHRRGTATPIEHLVVIFEENVSFDHYFATYPRAANTDGTPFHPRRDTPTVNGLGTLVNGAPSGVLLTDNPNAADGAQANPFRLGHDQAPTCDQDHAYGAEHQAFDFGLMDAFPAAVGSGGCGGFDYGHGDAIVMGYFDGNTATAVWSYAQQFAMNDNSYGTTFGPSTPGALNLIAGNTYPVQPSGPTPKVVSVGNGVGTLVGDLDPTGDVCSKGVTIAAGGRNVGDLLDAKGVTWGSFMGGFDLTRTNPDGSTGCDRAHPASTGGTVTDYIPHHAWFQYFASTANPTHARPASVLAIGHPGDGTNHEYDLHDFFDALQAGNVPAVSFLKAPAYQDAHAGYSDPLREQAFLVDTINTIEQSRFWQSTAIVVSYDDSDGWYDHQMGPIVNSSAVLNAASPANGDQLTGEGRCGNGSPRGGIEGRCGYGPRLPLLVISPFAKQNFVDHTLTDQSSILRFIEDNWHTGRIGGGSYDALAGSLTNMLDFSGPDVLGTPALFLDPDTGATP